MVHYYSYMTGHIIPKHLYIASQNYMEQDETRQMSKRHIYGRNKSVYDTSTFLDFFVLYGGILNCI